jgi:hypothetical protein
LSSFAEGGGPAFAFAVAFALAVASAVAVALSLSSLSLFFSCHASPKAEDLLLPLQLRLH